MNLLMFTNQSIQMYMKMHVCNIPKTAHSMGGGLYTIRLIIYDTLHFCLNLAGSAQGSEGHSW